MKKFILMLFMMVAMAATVFAQPFLVCDNQDDVDAYIVQFEGMDPVETPAPLHYDLNGIDPGDYVVTVKAKNGVWVSEPSIPLEFTKPSLSPPILELKAD